ncbi:MAG TPA: hypothetical protein VF168_03005 [Trueperaceae bacterium]
MLSLRLPLSLLLLLLLAPVGFSAQPQANSAPLEEEAFAGLTVIAHGEQVFDIFTGVTTLPEGGEIVDREHGITLTAEWISYREGEFVDAKDVEVTGEFGTAHADEVRIDLAAGRLDASGQVRYERDDLGLAAGALHYYPDDGVVSFEGPVTGVGAEFEAASAYFDGTSGVLVLAAPYRYQDALFELSSEREGALLALTPTEEGGLVASSSVTREVQQRLERYLGDTEESEVADQNSQP